MVYFDYNATAPLSPEARAAWLAASSDLIGNASSPHRLGSRAEVALDQARARLANLFGCKPLDIVWTSGATESNNTVLHHIARSAAADDEVWISSIEHPCVLAAAKHFFPHRVRWIPVGADGIVALDWIDQSLRARRPALVAVMAANNETGILQPWREIAALCAQAEVPFFCDAAQWCGKLPVAGLGVCAFVSGCAHKFGGPKGVGFLKSARKKIIPLLLGGEQEDGRRAGTENVAGVLAMLAALENCEGRLARGEHQLHQTHRDRFEADLLVHLPECRILGQHSPRLWNTSFFLTPPADGRFRWIVKLDKAGFAVSTGSACASGSEKPSHVLAALGHTQDEATRALRCSSGWETRPEDWQALLDAILQIASEV